jgi:uncharacterized protein (DUF1778 family)
MNPRGQQQRLGIAARSNKSARINLRVTPADKALLLGAAKATGVDLSTFIISTSVARAQQMLGAHEPNHG